MADRASREPASRRRHPAAKKKAGTEDTRVELLNVNHPGRKGLRVNAAKYEQVKRAILAAVPRGGEGLPFVDLFDAVVERVSGTVFEGASLSWYTTR